MAKSLLLLQARELRKKGISVKKIASLLSVSRSTSSKWVRDIILTVEQLEMLRESSLKGAELGRLKSALIQKEKRLKLTEQSKQLGSKELKILNNRELLVVGLGLYWGEGGKKNHRIEFCNSDPRMIKFLILWLTRCFKISIEELKPRVGINVIHAKREKVVREYWSEITGISVDRFNRTSFKKVNNKKIYENFNEHYGTLTIVVAKSANLYYKIMGLVDALYGSVA